MTRRDEPRADMVSLPDLLPGDERVGDGPVRHTLRTWPAALEAVWFGLKRYDIRRSDRDFRVGDHLVLLEWSPTLGEYGTRGIETVITYKTEGGEWGIPEGVCVLSLGHIHRFDLQRTRSQP